jgi:hypothetical protein
MMIRGVMESAVVILALITCMDVYNYMIVVIYPGIFAKIFSGHYAL